MRKFEMVDGELIEHFTGHAGTTQDVAVSESPAVECCRCNYVECECSRCHEVKECEFTVDPWNEMDPDNQADETHSWWCDDCWSERKDSI